MTTSTAGEAKLPHAGEAVTMFHVAERLCFSSHQPSGYELCHGLGKKNLGTDSASSSEGCFEGELQMFWRGFETEAEMPTEARQGIPTRFDFEWIRP